MDDQQLEESNGNAGKTAATNKVIVHILEKEKLIKKTQSKMF